MADIENQWGDDDDDEEVPAEEDRLSGCCILGCVACLACATLAASWALATFSFLAPGTSLPAQVLAGIGLGAGLNDLLYGCCCCTVAGDMCLRGNTEGIQQEDQPLVHAAVD